MSFLDVMQFSKHAIGPQNTHMSNRITLNHKTGEWGIKKGCLDDLCEEQQLTKRKFYIDASFYISKDRRPVTKECEHEYHLETKLGDKSNNQELAVEANILAVPDTHTVDIDHLITDMNLGKYIKGDLLECFIKPTNATRGVFAFQVSCLDIMYHKSKKHIDQYILGILRYFHTIGSVQGDHLAEWLPFYRERVLELIQLLERLGVLIQLKNPEVSLHNLGDFLKSNIARPDSFFISEMIYGEVYRIIRAGNEAYVHFGTDPNDIDIIEPIPYEDCPFAKVVSKAQMLELMDKFQIYYGSMDFMVGGTGNEHRRDVKDNMGTDYFRSTDSLLGINQNAAVPFTFNEKEDQLYFLEAASNFSAPYFDDFRLQLYKDLHVYICESIENKTYYDRRAEYEERKRKEEEKDAKLKLNEGEGDCGDKEILDEGDTVLIEA